MSVQVMKDLFGDALLVHSTRGVISIEVHDARYPQPSLSEFDPEGVVHLISLLEGALNEAGEYNGREV